MALIATVLSPFSLVLLLIAQMTSLVSSYPTLGNGLESHESTLSDRRDLSLSLSNLSANAPPAGFNFDVSKGARPTDSRGCLWLTLLATAELANYPFDGIFPRSWVSKSPEAPGLFLVLSGHSFAAFEVRYLIWGLLSAIRYMDRRNDYRNYRFTLNSHDVAVGSIIFGQTPSNSLDDDGNSSSLANKQLSPSKLPALLLTSGKTRLNATLDMMVAWDIAGVQLNFNEVMMILISGFSDVAVYDPSQRVIDWVFRSVFPPYESLIEIRSLTPAPLWFTYGVVYDALRQLANWYIHHWECKSAVVWIMVDERIVGQGFLRGRSSSTTVGGASLNVSNS